MNMKLSKYNFSKSLKFWMNVKGLKLNFFKFFKKFETLNKYKTFKI